MTALVARVRYPNFPGCKFIGHGKESAVRAGVSAKAFLAQEIDRYEAANEEKRKSPTATVGNVAQKVFGDQVVAKRGD